MGRSSVAAGIRPHDADELERVSVVESEHGVQAILDALTDPGCRSILEATSGAALSAEELSETCELPLSSTYRKIDKLSQAGLVEERTRIRHSKKHVSEYARVVDSVVISLDGSGATVLEVTSPEPG